MATTHNPRTHRKNCANPVTHGGQERSYHQRNQQPTVCGKPGFQECFWHSKTVEIVQDSRTAHNVPCWQPSVHSVGVVLCCLSGCCCFAGEHSANRKCTAMQKHSHCQTNRAKTLEGMMPCQSITSTQAASCSMHAHHGHSIVSWAKTHVGCCGTESIS